MVQPKVLLCAAIAVLCTGCSDASQSSQEWLAIALKTLAVVVCIMLVIVVVLAFLTGSWKRAPRTKNQGIPDYPSPPPPPPPAPGTWTTTVQEPAAAPEANATKRYAVAIVWSNGLSLDDHDAKTAEEALGKAIANQRGRMTLPLSGYRVNNISDDLGGDDL